MVADLFKQVLFNAGSPFISVWTAIVEVGFSVGGAIGAFSVLRDTMDCIWEVRFPKRRPLWRRIRQKIGPFVLVSVLGLIVIAWTAISSSLSSVIILYSINGTLTLVGYHSGSSDIVICCCHVAFSLNLQNDSLSKSSLARCKYCGGNYGYSISL